MQNEQNVQQVSNVVVMAKKVCMNRTRDETVCTNQIRNQKHTEQESKKLRIGRKQHTYTHVIYMSWNNQKINIESHRK